MTDPGERLRSSLAADQSPSAASSGGLVDFDSPEAAVEAVVGLTPSGRLGEASDMAAAVVFLASDASRFVNGTGLAVDGGMGS